MKKITLLFIISLIFNFSSAQIVAPWSENFNQINDGSGWSLMLNQEGGWAQWRVDGDLGGDGDIWHGWSLNPGIAPGDDSIPGYEDAYTLYHDDDQPPFGVVNDYIITPVLDCTQLSSPTVSFVEYQTYDSTWYEFHAVYYSEDYDGTNKETATWIELQNGPAPINTPTVVEHAIPSTTTAIAWQYQGNYADNWFIDDVVVGEASGGGGGSNDCPTPQITSWTMTEDGVVMDGTNDSSVQGYTLEWNATSFVPGDGTATGSASFNSFPFTLTGLEPGSYYFAMQSNCPNTTSDWIGPDNWTVGESGPNCPVISLPYFNDFGEVDAATGQPSAEAISTWSTCNDFYNLDSDSTDPGFANFWHIFPVDGTNIAAVSYSYYNGQILSPDNWFVLGPIDLTNEPDALLAWEMAVFDTTYYAENYSVYVGTSNEPLDLIDSSLVSFNEIPQAADANQFNARELDISAAVGNEVYIAFRHHDVSDQFVIAIDNVSITSTLSSEEFSIENLNYSYNIDSKLLTIDSSEMLRKVNIYNLLGQKIISNGVNGYNVNMNLSELNSSVYIVNVEGVNNTSDTFKIIVK